MADHRDSSIPAATDRMRDGRFQSVVSAGATAVGAYFDYKGAEKGEPTLVTPPIEAYSKELQDAAAEEMKALNGPCSRDTVNVSGCSALKRLVIDYGDLRQRIRAAKDEK